MIQHLSSNDVRWKKRPIEDQKSIYNGDEADVGNRTKNCFSLNTNE